MNEIQQKEAFLSEAKGLGKFFQLDVTLRLFGQIVWEWHFPPKSQSK